MAVTFAVSRQAVREALKVLAAKGLVESRRRTGTRVLPRSSWNLFDADVLAWHPIDHLKPTFLADLIEFRRVIEPAAAMLAAAKRDSQGLAVIRAALEKMRATINDNAAFNLSDREFHEAIFVASGNDLIERLGRMTRPLLDAVAPISSSTFDSHVADMVLHTALYETIEHRDPDKARAAMERILQQSADDRMRDQEAAARARRP